MDNVFQIVQLSPKMTQAEYVVSDGIIDDTQFLVAHRLARIVFETSFLENGSDNTPAKDRQLVIETWKEKLSFTDANILYVKTADRAVAGVTKDGDEQTDIRQPSRHSESQNTNMMQSTIPSHSSETMLGMFFCFPRSRDGVKSYHIWIAAVHPRARGQGVFPILMNATEQLARAAGYHVLTVATIPSRFERMYSILSRENSGWEILKWEALDDSQERKVTMKKMLV